MTTMDPSDPPTRPTRAIKALTDGLRRELAAPVALTGADAKVLSDWVHHTEAQVAAAVEYLRRDEQAAHAREVLYASLGRPDPASTRRVKLMTCVVQNPDVVAAMHEALARYVEGQMGAHHGD